MSISFSLKDFFQPLSLLRFRSQFSETPYMAPKQLKERLWPTMEATLRHAFDTVPHYQSFLANFGYTKNSFQSFEDLTLLPLLSKEEIRAAPTRFHSDNPPPHLSIHTSGSTGHAMEFRVDRSLNALEFAYYWRYWNRAGYKLGDSFVEFSASAFQSAPATDTLLFRRKWGTGRTLIDSRVISPKKSAHAAEWILKKRIKFLKGLPSVLYHFCLFLQEAGLPPLALKAVFSTGEVLFPHQRQLIEKQCGAKVFDSFGHMERILAVSECPAGSLHLNSDYGHGEFIETEKLPGGGRLASLTGTSYYNRSMPLLRYDTGDLVELAEEEKACECGWRFPIVNRIHGRKEDAVIRPDGSVAPTLFLIFEGLENVRKGNVVQTGRDKVLIRVEFKTSADEQTLQVLKKRAHDALGLEMSVDIEISPPSAGNGFSGEKQRVIRSSFKPPLPRPQ